MFSRGCSSRSLLMVLKHSANRGLSVARPSVLAEPTETERISYRQSYVLNPQLYDVAIVGGGIVGLATARELLMRYPEMKMAVLEKERVLAIHQSGHNSGVIHAGIYYAPGSMKAKLCVEGMKLAYDYLDKRQIPHKRCGKLIVAVKEDELVTLEDLMKRATANGVAGVRMVSKEEIPSIEPHCRGLRAIHSENTGIVDYKQMAYALAEDFLSLGGKILNNFEVVKFDESQEYLDYPIFVEGRETGDHLFERTYTYLQSRYVITCGGLQSDQLAKLSKCSTDPKIIPFRGDYLNLKPEACHLVRGNIYPVPDPRFPFLGVHFTPRVDGSVWMGPNAVLALKIEGYDTLGYKTKDAVSILTYPGFRRLALKYFTVGIDEMIRAFRLSRQVERLQRYVPELKVSDVEYGISGVRAQALDREGHLVDDFLIHAANDVFSDRVLHLRNAPSPAATSSLAIARLLCDKAQEQFGLSK